MTQNFSTKNMLSRLSTSNIEKSFIPCDLLNADLINDQTCPPVLKKLFANKFDNVLINLKLIFLILFIIASVLVADTDYIKKNPGLFTAETIIYSFSVAIAFVYIQWCRYDNSDNAGDANDGSTAEGTNKPSLSRLILFWFAIIFIGMIIINVLLQLSGFYTLLFDPVKISPNTITPYEKKIKALNESLYITIIGILLYIIFYLIFFAILVKDFDIKNYGSGGKFVGLFLLETVIFGLCNALPFIYIYVNRAHPHATNDSSNHYSTSETHIDENNYDSIKSKIIHSLPETLGLFIKMVILHVLLQAGGFYKHTMGF